MGGAYINKACKDKTYTYRAYIGGACIDKTCIDKACIDKACTDKAYNIIYNKSPAGISLGNSGFIYVKGPIKLKILLNLKEVKNLLVLI